jgi:hypothetical protein
MGADFALEETGCPPHEVRENAKIDTINSKRDMFLTPALLSTSPAKPKQLQPVLFNLIAGLFRYGIE